MEKNILSFSLNKCVACIYSLFNFLEKSNVSLSKNLLSKKVLLTLFPIMPRLVNKIYSDLFAEKISNDNWPQIDLSLLEEKEIVVPIQIKGKLVSTVNTVKGYNEAELLEKIYKIEKIQKKIQDKEILKIINVQDKIINIITN